MSAPEKDTKRLDYGAWRSLNDMPYLDRLTQSFAEHDAQDMINADKNGQACCPRRLLDPTTLHLFHGRNWCSGVRSDSAACVGALMRL